MRSFAPFYTNLAITFGLFSFVTALCNLELDIGEKNDLSRKRLEIIKRMTSGFMEIIDRGTSRADQKPSKDTANRFDTVHTKRWGPELEA